MSKIGSSLKQGETMAFVLEEDHAYIEDYDPDVFPAGLIDYFWDSGDVDVVYEEVLKEYEREGAYVNVYVDALYDSSEGHWDADFGFVVPEVWLEIHEVKRVEVFYDE